MGKNYQILNSKSNKDNTIFYVLYIVLILIIIFVVYKFFTYNKLDKKENFEQINSNKNIYPEHKLSNLKSEINNKLSNEQIMNELQQKNNELMNLKSTLQNKLEEQSKAIYINKHFDKVDSSSYNDELSFLLTDFANTQFPKINLNDKKIIQTDTELKTILNEASQMKNYYKPGDIVSSNSTFNITKDDICYRHNGKPIKPDLNFIEQYPNCMVCSVEDPLTLKNSNAWTSTKTNINKVCLYNQNAKENSGIPNLSQCQEFCGIINK